MRADYREYAPPLFVFLFNSRMVGNDEEVEGCLCGSFDTALQFVPWVRLERAMGIVAPAFWVNKNKPEEVNDEFKLSPLATSLHSPPALGKWVSVHCPGAEIASVRWMGHVLGWEWKAKLKHQLLPPEQIRSGLLFCGEKLMRQLSSHSLPDGRRYSLLKGLTMKVVELNEKEEGGREEKNGEHPNQSSLVVILQAAAVAIRSPTTTTALELKLNPPCSLERNGAQLFLNLQCDAEVPLQAQCGLVAGNYSSATASLADVVEEARNVCHIITIDCTTLAL